MRSGTTQPLTATRLTWYDVQPQGAGVRCQMPVIPRVQSGGGQADDGARRRTTMVRGEARYGFFGLYVAEWEGGIVGDPLPEVAESAGEIFASAELERERSRRLEMDGFYGREDIGTDRRGAFVALRQFVGSDRVIVAVAVVPRSPDLVQIAERFMGSISLDRANALFPSGGSRRSDGSWTPVYMPEGDFGVSMPSAPSVAEEEQVFGGQRATVQTFQTRDGWGLYRVRVVSFPSSVPEGAFSDLRASLEFENEVRPEHANGFPGRVFTTDVGHARSWARVFQTSGRLYVVEAVGPRHSVRDRNVQQTLLRYFNSFRIL